MSMIESDIKRLIKRDASFSLAELESDVWAREAQVQGDKNASRRLAFCQAGVMVLAIVGSTAAGLSLAMHSSPLPPKIGITAIEYLAPSTLLFGRRQ